MNASKSFTQCHDSPESTTQSVIDLDLDDDGGRVMQISV